MFVVTGMWLCVWLRVFHRLLLLLPVLNTTLTVQQPLCSYCYWRGGSVQRTEPCARHYLTGQTNLLYSRTVHTVATKAPIQWSLTRSETVQSFEKWRQNVILTLAEYEAFTPYLEVTWKKKTNAEPYRGFTDDTTHTAIHKNATVDLLLGRIANFCPVISRNTIVKNSTCLKDVWSTIRLHYGFQISESQFLDITNIDERPEDSFQRLMTSIEDDSPTVGGDHARRAPYRG